MNMLRLLIACGIIAQTFGWPRINVTKRSVPASGSNVKWTPSHPESTRRLAMDLTNSHDDTSNAECIVGGLDMANPLEIYVGGPCSELTVNGDTVTPSADFRWIVMKTEHIDITDGTTSAETEFISGTEVVVAQDVSTHAEIAVGMSQKMKAAAMDHAAMYACTTSYLAQATFEYNENSFVFGTGDADRSVQCVVPCCTDPGSTGCACDDGCPDTQNQASPGMFKYSIMAAAYDLSGATAGATGNGWERVVEDYGTETDGAKVLTGYVDIYQSLDFTNMQSDTLTIITPDGSEVTYSNMGTCDFLDGAATGCAANAVEVESMKVESGNWTGYYGFPQTFNGGLFTDATIHAPAVAETRKVEIYALKPTDGNLNTWGKAGLKWMLVRYRFDVTGITKGGYFNYDPTVASDESVSAPAPTPATAADYVSGASGIVTGVLQAFAVALSSLAVM